MSDLSQQHESSEATQVLKETRKAVTQRMMNKEPYDGYHKVEGLKVGMLRVGRKTKIPPQI